jgi:hypothetical protein
VYGLEAINEANGWNMAALGILVVFSSLIILSIIIAQVHKLLDIWDNRKALIPTSEPERAGLQKAAAGKPETEKNKNVICKELLVAHAAFCPENTHEIVDIWKPLIQKLEDPFHLADLYKIAAENDLPHPHLTINRLRREQILIPTENQKFTFNYDRHDDDQE